MRKIIAANGGPAVKVAAAPKSAGAVQAWGPSTAAVASSAAASVATLAGAGAQPAINLK